MMNTINNKKIKLYTENNYIEQYNSIIHKFKNCPYGSIEHCLFTYKDSSYDKNLKLNTYEEKEIYREFEDFCNAQKLFKIYLDFILQISTTRQDYNKLSLEVKEQLEITHNLAKYINQSLQVKRYNPDGKLNTTYIRNTLQLNITLARADIKQNLFLSQVHLDNAIRSIKYILGV